MKNLINISVLCILLSFFSCGNKSTGNSTSAESTKTSENATPAKTDSPVESTKPSENDYLGTWVKDGDPNCKFEITKEGNIFNIKDNCGRAGQAVYTMTDNGNLNGLNGIITVAYNKETRKLLYAWTPIKEYYTKK